MLSQVRIHKKYGWLAWNNFILFDHRLLLWMLPSFSSILIAAVHWKRGKNPTGSSWLWLHTPREETSDRPATESSQHGEIFAHLVFSHDIFSHHNKIKTIGEPTRQKSSDDLDVDPWLYEKQPNKAAREKNNQAADKRDETVWKENFITQLIYLAFLQAEDCSPLNKQRLLHSGSLCSDRNKLDGETTKKALRTKGRYVCRYDAIQRCACVSLVHRRKRTRRNGNASKERKKDGQQSSVTLITWTSQLSLSEYD